MQRYSEFVTVTEKEIVLTRVSCGSPDSVAAQQELLHHPRPDEAACSRHADQLLLFLTIAGLGIGRHGETS